MSINDVANSLLHIMYVRYHVEVTHVHAYLFCIYTYLDLKLNLN